MRAFVIALTLITTPAAAAEQFDLVCKAKRADMHYRVDLVRGEWCADKCERIMKLAEVTSGLLTLYEEKAAAPHFVEAHATINRMTGEWRWYYYHPSTPPAMDHKGTCTPAPFSGFADAERKF